MRSRLTKKDDSHHVKKVFKYTLFILFFILIMISSIGYISVGNDAKNFDLIIQRRALNGSKDIPMKIGNVLFAFVSKYLLYNVQ